LFVGVVTISGLALVACSGDDDDGGGGNNAAPTATRPAASGTAAPTATVPAGAIAVSMVDFGYQPGVIPARAGQRVQLQVSNRGQTPHTFTIDGVIDSGGMAAGESKLIEFTPAQAAMLTFYCTIHGRSTMSGELNVTQ
jgi:plastocyanin